MTLLCLNIIILLYVYSSKELISAIEESWEANFGYVCVGVSWDLFPSAVDDAKVSKNLIIVEEDTSSVKTNTSFTGYSLAISCQ